MKSEVEQVATRSIEVANDTVATALATSIVSGDMFEDEPEEAIEAGVQAAIDEIDNTTFEAAFDVIQAAVSVEVEGQAKRIALRMIRELAAKAERDAATAG